ncbi:hypothetical protein WMF37_18905 [Sorangium sp. So ce291]|uniref:hypothetical protein n=1 Tax=Sorangium sp. So ce291 TaxID=3133294 RepID=UPI003F5FFA35
MARESTPDERTSDNGDDDLVPAVGLGSYQVMLFRPTSFDRYDVAGGRSAT